MERKSDRMDAMSASGGRRAMNVAAYAATSPAGEGSHREQRSEKSDGNAEREGIVAELSRELTRRERLVVMLRYTEELTVAEIAAVLEIAVTEVERMLESVAERVRRRIKPAYGSIRSTFA